MEQVFLIVSVISVVNSRVTIVKQFLTLSKDEGVMNFTCIIMTIFGANYNKK